MAVQGTLTAEAVPTNYRRLFLDETISLKTGGQATEAAQVIPDVQAVSEGVGKISFPSLVELDWVIFNLNLCSVISE